MLKVALWQQRKNVVKLLFYVAPLYIRLAFNSSFTHPYFFSYKEVGMNEKVKVKSNNVFTKTQRKIKTQNKIIRLKAAFTTRIIYILAESKNLL